MQCVKLETHLPKILGGNTTFVVGSLKLLCPGFLRVPTLLSVL